MNHEAAGQHFIMTGSDDHSVRYWQLRKQGTAWDTQLYWASSGRSGLLALGAQLSGASGLEKNQRQLLCQRGVEEKTAVLTTQLTAERLALCNKPRLFTFPSSQPIYNICGQQHRLTLEQAVVTLAYTHQSENAFLLIECLETSAEEKAIHRTHHALYRIDYYQEQRRQISSESMNSSTTTTSQSSNGIATQRIAIQSVNDWDREMLTLQCHYQTWVLPLAKAQFFLQKIQKEKTRLEESRSLAQESEPSFAWCSQQLKEVGITIATTWQNTTRMTQETDVKEIIPTAIFTASNERGVVKLPGTATTSESSSSTTIISTNNISPAQVRVLSTLPAEQKAASNIAETKRSIHASSATSSRWSLRGLFRSPAPVIPPPPLRNTTTTTARQPTATPAKVSAQSF